MRTESERRAHYTRLHEGREPDAIRRVPARRLGRYRFELGETAAIEYRKPVRGRYKLYRHEFENNAGPMLTHDEHGAMDFQGGQYTVTDRGIEDRVPMANVTLYNPGMDVLGGLKAGAKLGVTAGLATLGAGYAMRNTNLGAAARGGIAGVALAAIGIGAAAKLGWYNVGGGLVAAGFVTATAGAATEIRQRRALSAKPAAKSMDVASMDQSQLGAGTNPSAQAMYQGMRTPVGVGGRNGALR